MTDIPLFVGYETHPSLDERWRRGERIELDARQLPRHTFVCGSTGSGKTVFAKAMVEEAVLQDIPTIVIDIKGDLASLALPGSEVDSPWMKKVLGAEYGRARREYSEGLAEFPAVMDRVGRFGRRVHPRLFTPRSSLGRQLAMASLPSFDLADMQPTDLESFRRLNEAFSRALVSSLFGASAVARRRKDEEVRVVEELNWRAMKDARPFEGPAGIKRLANQIIEPPITEIGGLAYEEFLPPKRQMDLRRRLASSVAGAGAHWYSGESLDVDSLLAGAPKGRVPLAIVYLGHIDNFEEQAFVVARVATAIYQWMRGKGGTTQPRLLLYMDEVGGGDAKTGFFPSAPYSPVSKSPLSLLVKQGRSAGVATLFATQNPVSVDLRALANVHTWAVGRLSQKNDQERVRGALSEGHGGMEKLRKWLPRLPTHTFLIKSEGSGFGTPVPVQERWLYTLHEPLGLDAVRRLGEALAARRWEPSTEEPVRGPSPPPSPAPDRPAQDPGRGGESGTLPLTGALPSTEAESPPPGWKIATSRDSAQALTADRSIVVGRSSSADLTIADRYASGRHLEFLARGRTLFVTDLGASNPARLDDVPVKGTMELDAALSPVSIVVGKTEIRLTWE